MIESLLYFMDLYNVHHADFGVYPYSLLELVAFSVQVVGLEHIVCLEALDPEAPIFLQQPPHSTTCPNNPYFDILPIVFPSLRLLKPPRHSWNSSQILVRDQALRASAQSLSFCTRSTNFAGFREFPS